MKIKIDQLKPLDCIDGMLVISIRVPAQIPPTPRFSYKHSGISVTVAEKELYAKSQQVDDAGTLLYQGEVPTFEWYYDFGDWVEIDL